MASTVPASLRSAGIVGFATRAAQIEKAKPAVAYWCNYWIVQQLVTKGLHNTDEESKAYTASLMDKLEQSKTEHGNEDAILDDIAAKAYLEQFGLEVFNRADNAIRANKASKQTADTLQAAYTFLELLQIWPPLDPEIAARIKFAKFHAVRIAKAVKAGEDPNLSNPASDPVLVQEAPPLDPQDPEVQALGGLTSPPPAHQPSVEEIPDEHQQLSPTLARTSQLDESLHPSRVGSAGPSAPGIAPAPSQPQPDFQDMNNENYYQQRGGGDVSPLEPSAHGRASSEGGGYFPRVSPDATDPTISAHNAPPSVTQPPTFDSVSQPSAPAPVSPILPSPTDNLPQAPPYTQQPPQAPAHLPQQHQPPSFPGYQYPPTQPIAPPMQPTSPAFAPAPPAQQQQWQQQPPPQAAQVVVDDEAMSRAQKHARWAISALNFEDVTTAVRELQGALKALGAG